MRFFLGPIIIVVGILMMKYTVQITEFTGKLDFAEKYFGAGVAAGTYTWWRFVGLVFVILATFWMFGMLSLLGDLLRGIFVINN